ncbi:MAG: glycosyltransferase family 2 protein [Methanobrevibacter sp.]|jgi:glycosyltransferase involved in cell wall biosynthesis|nr:glycosyltransferase family 2 protein [Methanobrevibacter sp.]
MELKISVIIPVYNRASLLKQAIDSIMNQSFGFENIELIIVDNNSTDDTKGTIENYAKKYENIHPIFREKNSGSPNIPRNNGIDAAQGKYIMFLDSDDVYQPELCEKLYKAAEEYGANFAECWVRDSNFYNEENNPSENTVVVHDHEKKDFSIINTLLWNKLYYKNFLNEHNIRFPKDISNEDLYFAALCYLNTDTWLEVKYVGYIHQDDSTHLAASKKFHVGIYKGTKLTYDILKSKNSYLSQFSLKLMPDLALEFLRHDFTVNERKQILKCNWELFKSYDSYDSLSIPMRIFMKTFSSNIKIAILLSKLYNFLKIESLIKNKYIRHHIVARALGLGNYNWGE